jgi:hypothetical protein
MISEWNKIKGKYHIEAGSSEKILLEKILQCNENLKKEE